MRPPALKVGWEFVQSQPMINKGTGFPTTLTATITDVIPTSVTQMLAYQMRFRLVATVSVYIKSSFNLNDLVYNEFIFDLNQFLAFVFGDIVIVFDDQTVQTAGTSTTPLWIPPLVYKQPNICFDAGYNYQAISMKVTTTIKYPSCYKNVITSLGDWSQWTKVITNFGNN